MKLKHTCTRVILVLACVVSFEIKGIAASKFTTGPRKPFPTHFQNESQFIVETITSDLAFQAYYAKYKKLPDANQFAVLCQEKTNSPNGALVYSVAASFGENLPSLKTELGIDGPVWSPSNYSKLTSDLAKLLGLTPSRAGATDDTKLLALLTDSTARTIATENKSLAEAVGKSFDDYRLHERAALLLGAFSIRDHAGDFKDVRIPLCRMTAHLALASCFADGKPAGLNGQIATAMLYTLMNNQATALEKLTQIDNTDAAVSSWVRTLRSYNTSDYRSLDKVSNKTGIEQVAWFRAFARSVNVNEAWARLSEKEKMISDVVRVANEERFSVEVGHELMALSVKLELNECGIAYQICKGQKLAAASIVNELNSLPLRQISTTTNQGFEIIDWGLWAQFLQRHLCNAIKQNYDFLCNRWGVREAAAEYAETVGKNFGALQLYPFVERFTCTDQKSYEASVDAGFVAAHSAPHLAPPGCWRAIYTCPGGMTTYLPNVFVWRTWFKHVVPPGTAYDPAPHLYGLRFERPINPRFSSTNALTFLQIAPYDPHIARWIIETLYNGKPTPDNVENVYRPVLAYATPAMRALAEVVGDAPERYEQIMTKAAELDHSKYVTLGWYFRERQQDDKAAKYYEKGLALNPDSVHSASYADWMVRYYLQRGEKEKARKLADTAAEVYSSAGLKAKAEFHEAIGEFQTAFDWHLKAEERYGCSDRTIIFCVRYKTKTGDSRFDTELQKRLPAFFPKGIEKVTLKDFQLPPTDGMQLGKDNESHPATSKLQVGDIVVAVGGVRVHNSKQYLMARKFDTNPAMSLIVWQKDRYASIDFSTFDHRIGMLLFDYSPVNLK